MRIIAIDQTDGTLRVAYRWTNSVFEQPRLLISGSNLPLADLRRVIERDHLGGPMSAAEYQVVALVADSMALDAVQAAFARFEVIGIPLNSPQFINLTRWRNLTDRPEDRVLTLTYYGADQITFAELLDHFERGFMHWAPYSIRPDTFQDILPGIRNSVQLMLIGRSVQALRDSCHYLVGDILRIPVIPEKAAIGETHYQGFPLTVIDSRAIDSFEALIRNRKMPTLVILAVASDPGPGASDLPQFSSDEWVIVSLVNTHNDVNDYNEIYAYLQSALNNLAQIVEAPQIEAAIHARLGTIIGAWLINWLSSYFPVPDKDEFNRLPADLRRDLQRTRLVIDRLTGR